MSVDPFEYLDEQVAKAEPTEALRLYIFQTHPLASRGSITPLEVRRDVELLDLLHEHLARNGAVSGTFECKLKGAKSKHFGSATVPLTVTPRSEALPKPSEAAAPEAPAAPAPVPPAPKGDLAAFVERKLQQQVARRLERMFDEDDVDEDEDDDEEESEDEDEPTENPAPGFLSTVVNKIGTEKVAGMFEEGGGLLVMGLKGLLDSFTEKNKAQARYWRNKDVPAGTATRDRPTVRVVPNPPPAKDAAGG